LIYTPSETRTPTGPESGGRLTLNLLRARPIQISGRRADYSNWNWNCSGGAS